MQGSVVKFQNVEQYLMKTKNYSMPQQITYMYTQICEVYVVKFTKRGAII